MIFYIVVLLVLLYMIFGNPFLAATPREPYEFLTVDSDSGDLAIVDSSSGLEAKDGGGLKSTGDFDVDGILKVKSKLYIGDNLTFTTSTKPEKNAIDGYRDYIGINSSDHFTEGVKIMNGSLRILNGGLGVAGNINANTASVAGNLTAGGLTIGGTTITEEHLKILTGDNKVRLSNAQRGVTGGLATLKDNKGIIYARDQVASVEQVLDTEWRLQLTPYTQI